MAAEANPAAASEGAAPAAPEAGAPAAGDDRSALVAELEALGNEPAAEPADKPADKPEGADDPDPDEETAGDGEDEAKEGAEEEGEGKADPELDKRLDAIQRAEKRSRDAIEQARREFEVERQRVEQQLAPQREALAQWQAAQKRAKYDPVGVLTSLGLGPDDFEAIARDVYAHSTAGQKDPKLRDQSARTLREREAADEVATLRQQYEKLQAQIEADKTQRQLDAYLDSVGKAVSEQTPLVRSLVTNDPSGARAELHRIAEQLYAKTGEVPAPGDVAAELEKTERARLKRLGIDIPAAGTKAAPKTPPPEAGETRGKTITNNMAGTPAKPRSEPLTPEQEREDILANWPG